MPQVSVQLHHLVLFVFVVFSFNVVILAYLTGAFKIGSVSKLTSSLASKISIARPTKVLPPWQRTKTAIVALVTELPSESARFGEVHISDCTLGLWSSGNQGFGFCKRKPKLWIEFEGRTGKDEYIELWMTDIEVALYNDKRGVAILVRNARAFRGQGRTSDSAIRNAFENLISKDGTLRLQGKAVEDKKVDEQERALEIPAVESEVNSIEDTGKQCSMLWSKEDEVTFCQLGNTPEVWVELESDGKVKFRFKQLYHEVGRGEVGLFDESRLVVICLLRRYGLIGYPASPDEALQVARETDVVFFQGGRWRSDEPLKPIPPRVSKNAKDDAKLVLLISSYRDVLCSNTLKEAFDNAFNPSRIHIAVVNQANIGDIDCLDDYCKEVGEDRCRRSQVTQIRLPLDKSRGVMFARFLQQTLIRDEEFCLQTDSHMVFPTHWDRVAIEDWLTAENEMAVMTTYPNRAIDRNDQQHSPVRCDTVWGSNVVACGTSAHNVAHKQKSPHLIAFFGAGIAFSKCHANLVVPYDPYMSFLFKGEEYNRSSRLWTHGYDLYAPKKNYAYHFYDDDPRPERFKNVHRDRSFFGSSADSSLLLRQSEYRWQAVMGMIPLVSPNKPSSDLDRAERLRQAHAKASALKEIALTDVDYFGLGNKRSLREYEIFSGINLAKHTNKDLCDQIGKMPWIPWNNTHYEPLGQGCSTPSRSCCKTTLDRAMDRGGFLSRYVGLTNDEWASVVKKSETVGRNWSEVLRGAIVETKGWSGATKLC